MKAFSLLYGLMLSGLFACSSVDQRPPIRSAEAEAAAQLVNNARGRTDAGARADLLKALGIFEGLDDRAGRWSASFALADWHIAHRDDEAATAYSSDALALAPQLASSEVTYESSLQLAQLTKDRHLLLEALSHAESALDRAVVHVLLEDYEAADKELAILTETSADAELDPAPLGFVLYRVGKHRGEMALVLQALDNFRLAADVYGVTDSLFLAATLEASPSQARSYAERALLSARQSGEATRIAAITNWLEQEGRGQ